MPGVLRCSRWSHTLLSGKCFWFAHVCDIRYHLMSVTSDIIWRLWHQISSDVCDIRYHLTSVTSDIIWRLWQQISSDVKMEIFQTFMQRIPLQVTCRDLWTGCQFLPNMLQIKLLIFSVSSFYHYYPTCLYYEGMCVCPFNCVQQCMW